MKLATRILILAGVTLLPGLLAGSYNELALRRERAEEVDQLAMRNTRQAAAYVEQVLQSVRSVLLAVSVSDNLKQSDRCGVYLASLNQALDYISGMGLIDSEGILQCASGAAAPIDLSDRSYFIEARRTRAFHVGEYIQGRLSQRAQLMTALPVGAEGEKQAVLFASLDLGWLQKRIENVGLPEGANVTIADRNGIIIARNPQPERFVGTKIPDAFMHLVRAENAGTLELKSQDGTTRILAYMPVQQEPVGIYVSSGLSKTAAFGLIDRSTAFAAAISIAAAALALFVAAMLGRYFIAGPVEGILRTIEAHRRGETARTGAHPRQGEIAQIGWSLDRLFDELDDRDRQRDLLSKELAHRVKNTLAIVQAIAAQTINRGPSGFSSFSARLNALGQAYDVLLAGTWHQSRIQQALEAAIAPHQSSGSQQIHVVGDDAVIDARAVLALSMVIHELCTNALKHGALSTSAGRVEIRVSVLTNGVVQITWDESGGPPVAERGTPGFGTTLIKNAFPAEFAAQINVEYRREGVHATIAFRNVMQAEAA